MNTPLILIAEDDPEVRQALERILSFEGYRHVSANDGAAALEAIPLAPADLGAAREHGDGRVSPESRLGHRGRLAVERDTGLQRADDELFGGYEWRREGELLVVPFPTSPDSHALWSVDAATGTASRVTDPAATPFKIANGDWSVSPDGSRVAFVEAGDKAIWVLELPSS